MFVPLNNFFSTAILLPSLEIGTGYEVLTTFTACQERPSKWALRPIVWVCCVEVGWLSGRLASINRGTSVVANYAGLFCAFCLLTNALECVKMSRALTTVAPEISIIPRGTNFVKCFFAQILDVENPVFCHY